MDQDSIAAVIAGAVATPAGGFVGWWVRGGRSRSRIDVAEVITAASASVVTLMQGELARLTARVEVAETRAAESQQLVDLLASMVRQQSTAGQQLTDWATRAAQAIRAAGGQIEDPPEMPDVVVPVAVHHTTTTTSTTTTPEG